MRILFIDDTIDFGGGQIMLQTYLSYCDKYETILIRPSKAKEGNETWKCKKFYKLNFAIADYVSFLDKILFCIKTTYLAIKLFYITSKEKPDVIIVNSLQGLVPFLLLKLFLKAKIIFCVHTIQISKSYKTYLLTKVCDKFIVCCKAAGELYPFKIPYDIVYNVLEHQGFYIAKRKQAKGNITIGYVGRLIDDKNVDILVRAFSDFNKKYSKSKLYIIGDGPEKKKLLDLIEKLGVQESVIITGFVHDVCKYYNLIDVLCLPSSFEAFPLVIQEAMVNGVPVVASKVGGITEIITSMQNGLLLDVISETAIYKAFKYIVENDNSDICKNAYSTVMNKFSYETQKIRFIKVIKSL